MTPETRKWVEALAPEELNFIRRFVLASGSLKEMAREYGVSYPTIRSRLDALIEKIARAGEAPPDSALKAEIRALLRRGSIDAATARQLIEAGDKDMEAVKISSTERAAIPTQEGESP